MNVKFTILGSGTSTGVPQIGCTCPVCTSDDPHDRRMRCSSFIETNNTRILLDCGPDFYHQALRYMPYKPIDGVLISHEHFDHVGGIDDLRAYCHFGDVDIYANEYSSKSLRERMPYCFVEERYPGIPLINLYTVPPYHPFAIGDVEVLPIEVIHGKLPILGYVMTIGDIRIGYITDMKTMDERNYSILEHLDLLVMNALRIDKHWTHQTLDEALLVAKEVKAKQTVFVHMSHDMGCHADIDAQLPGAICLGYDGLQFEFETNK